MAWLATAKSESDGRNPTSTAISRKSGGSPCWNRTRVHVRQALARARRPRGAHQLVNSHLRLVAGIARGHRGYGLPISELVSEGNVGLMQAIKRFEPDKGFQLATYAT